MRPGHRKVWGNASLRGKFKETEDAPPDHCLGEAVGDFFPDDGAEFAVGLEFHVGMADASGK